MMVDETFFVTAGEQHTVNVNVEVVADAAGMNSKGILIKCQYYLHSIVEMYYKFKENDTYNNIHTYKHTHIYTSNSYTINILRTT